MVPKRCPCLSQIELPKYLIFILISFAESHAKWLFCSSEVFSACGQHFDKSFWYKIVPRCDKILPATRIFRTRKSNARPQFTLRDFYTRKRNCAAFERCQGDYGETKFSIRIKYYCMIWAKLISVIVYIIEEAGLTNLSPEWYTKSDRIWFTLNKE